MKIHHLLTAAFGFSLLLAPLFSIILALIGLGLYTITGDQETALWICGVAVGTSLLLMPIAYWFFSPASPEQNITNELTIGAHRGPSHPVIRGLLMNSSNKDLSSGCAQKRMPVQ